MKIVIAEGGPAENVGSMALIENAIKIARLKFPNVNITVFTPTVDSVQLALSKDGIADVNVMLDLFQKPPSKASSIFKVIWFLKTILWIIFIRLVQGFRISPVYFASGDRKRVLKEIAESDYVFCIGAERINDVFFKSVFLSLEALRIYQKLGKKIVHFSLTIGPLYYKISMRKAHVVLDNSYAIFVRDKKSIDWLNELKVAKPFIYDSYDVALLQDTADNTDQLLQEFAIKPGFIGVSFIEWAFRKVEGPVRMEGYINAVASALDFLSEKYGYQIVFVPTVVNTKGYRVDDIEACQKVIDKMAIKTNHVLINRLLTPKEMASVFSACRFSIVTRMHAAILCSGAGKKPIVSVNYLYKLREYMKNIDFESYSVDIDYVTSDKLISLCEEMEINYHDNLEKVEKNTKVCKNKLLADVDFFSNKI